MASAATSSKSARKPRGIRLSGYIAALAEQGPTRGPQNVFINRRIVKDRTIAHAIIDSYSMASIKERSPEVHLFIEMPPDAVDVNVHPTKAEVRFREQSLVHEVVRRALMEALGQGGVPQLQLRPEQVVPAPRSLRRFPAFSAEGRIRTAGCQALARHGTRIGRSRRPTEIQHPARTLLPRPAPNHSVPRSRHPAPRVLPPPFDR